MSNFGCYRELFWQFGPIALLLKIKKLLKIEVPIRAKYIRVIFCEIGRILSHILNVTTQALDVGALTPSLWGFEERETLMTFYEMVFCIL